MVPGELRILIIEDDEIYREALERLLDESCRLTFAETGGEAEAALTGAPSTPPPFDCALLDYRLPDISGLELLPLLRARRLPVVMMTAQGSEQVAVEAMRLGCRDYLVKNAITADSLAQAIDRALSHTGQGRMRETRRIASELGLDAEEIRERATFMGLGRESAAALSELREVLVEEVDSIVAEFYQTLERHPEPRALIAMSGERLRDAFRDYLLSLGDGIERPAYIENRLKVGVRHEEEGVSYKWYLAGFCRLSDIVAARLAERHAGSASETARSLRALHKVLALDALLAVEAYFNAATRRLEDAQRLLEDVSRTDALTRVDNRRYLMQRLENEFDRSRRFDHPMALLMVDIDNFKAFNDKDGHLFGDEVLRAVARVIRRQVRKIDLVGRYGGDEFVIGLAECDRTHALEIAERIRASVAAEKVVLDEAKGEVTVTLGLALLGPETRSVEDLLAAADAALYEAKSQGRNQTGVFRLGDSAREATKGEVED